MRLANILGAGNSLGHDNRACLSNWLGDCAGTGGESSGVNCYIISNEF